MIASSLGVTPIGREVQDLSPFQASQLPSSQLDPSDLRTAIATAEVWKGGYRAIDLNQVLIRQWKLAEDCRNPIEVIRELPDHQKPHLPEGYVWLKEGDDLKILGAKDRGPLNFRIFLFGPDHVKHDLDERKRVQYLVEDLGSPIHGFAMAKREGFSEKKLRTIYPITTDSFKVGEVTYWRGHIIDYNDTLGSDSEQKISTLFALNYKPEPAGAWANSLRKKVVSEIRNGGGSYSEIMLYDPTPTRTNGGRAVPAAIFMETFNYGKERLNGYYVPKDHECHGWMANGIRNFAEKSLVKLSQSESFPALVFDSTDLSRSSAREEWRKLPSNLERLNVKDAFHLRRKAEMEFDSAAHMLSYAIYAKTQGASPQVLQFWLGRVVDMAAKIDKAYASKVLAFPLFLMNSTTAVYTASFLDTNPNLKSLVGRLSVITYCMMESSSHLSNMTAVKKAPMNPQQVQLQTAEKTEASFYDLFEVVATFFNFLSGRAEPRPVSLERAPDPAPVAQAVDPAQISCEGINPRNDQSVEKLMKVLEPLIARGSPITLTGLSSEMGNKILPRISKASLERGPQYRPLQRVEVSHPRYLKTISDLVQKLFGADIPVEVFLLK